MCLYHYVKSPVSQLVPQVAQNWNEQEVIARWQQLFSLPLIIEHYQSGQLITPAQQKSAKKLIELWHERLTDLSWFMRCLNEPIARQANAEDKCTGRFWESRFKSQALLNEQTLLVCMAYVDLNPIRADVCNSLETSEFTSVKRRIDQIKQYPIEKPIALAPFVASHKTDQGIPFVLKDYLELTNWTGRVMHPKKKGVIKPSTPKLLHQLGIDASTWMDSINSFSSRPYAFIGSEQQ